MDTPMDIFVITLSSFLMGMSRMFGKQDRTYNMASKDKYLFMMALVIIFACFSLISIGHNTSECFGLIGIVVGHFFGREMGKNE
jgi:hypothetical protein